MTKLAQTRTLEDVRTKGFLFRVFSCFRVFVVPAGLLASVICCAGCVDRARVNVDCRWVHETKASVLDLSARANREHLDDDALFAEDLAIRFADAQRGHRSGHFKGVDEYERAADQCMT